MSFFQLFIKNRKILLPIVLAAGLFGFVIASIMPVYYKAETVIFPPNTHVSDHLISAGLRFGGDKEIDEHIQLLTSVIVRDSMIRKFDLKTHYELDSNSPTFLDDLFEKYDENVSVNRTAYNSIAISIWDQSPELAANMANQLVDMTDRIKSRMFDENIKAAFQKNEKAYLEKKKEVDLLLRRIEEIKTENLNNALENKANKIKEVRANLDRNNASLQMLKDNYSIYELDSQLGDLYTSYLLARQDFYNEDGALESLNNQTSIADTIVSSHKRKRNAALFRIKALKPRIDSLNYIQKDYGELVNDQEKLNHGLQMLEDDYRLILSDFDKEFVNQDLQYVKSQYDLEFNFLLELKKKRDEMKGFIDAKSPTSYLVSPAKKTQKKDKPKRTLIALASACAAFFISILVLLIKEEDFSAKLPL